MYMHIPGQDEHKGTGSSTFTSFTLSDIYVYVHVIFQDRMTIKGQAPALSPVLLKVIVK